VEPDFVLVGGGAEIENVNAAQPGALITASFPIDLSIWTAASKDHLEPYPHRLRAYAIGMKIDGVTSSQLRSATHLYSAISHQEAHPEVNLVNPDTENDIVIGGGAGTLYSGGGQLLVASEPLGLLGWHAASKDHEQSDPGRVKAYLLTVRRCPVGTGGPCLKNALASGVSAFGGGYRGAAAGTDWSPDWLTTSLGANATASPGAGRMIADIFPVNSNTQVWTKDHRFATDGFAQALAIKVSAQ
jgi:hypothetical protein